MTTINRLSAVNSLEGGDQLPIYDQGNGDARKASLSLLLSWIQSGLTFPSEDYTTQRSTPSATGFSVSITDGSSDIHLILTPTAGFAAGTIVLPASTNAVDKQRVLVNCTQAVTALTIDKNGATAITGAPTALTANDFFTLKYDAQTSTWYRVG